MLLGFALGLYAAGAYGLARLGPGSLYDQELVTEIFERASPAVVEVVIYDGAGPLNFVDGAGSGFLVDSAGHVVTNQHVVDGAGEVTVVLHDGTRLPATRQGHSAADDLAVVKVDAGAVAGIAPLPLADSDDVRPGQLAIAIGSPYRNLNSVGVGIVSGSGRGPASVLNRPMPDMIQTDAPLNPGNSGGPLLNAEGEVIGVNSAVRIGSGGVVDEFRIGYAVPSNTIRALLPDLVVAQEVRRPWLGISGVPLTEEVMNAAGIDEGIFVTRVFGGSPAERAGLTPYLASSGVGDIITAVDGTAMRSVEDMVSYFNTLRPGARVTLTLQRGERGVDVDVVLAAWPESGQ